MSTTITPPASEETCAYCESWIFDHDPICVRDCSTDCGSPTYFRNYSCLSAYIDEYELTSGNASSGRRAGSRAATRSRTTPDLVDGGVCPDCQQALRAGHRSV